MASVEFAEVVRTKITKDFSCLVESQDKFFKKWKVNKRFDLGFIS